MLDADALTSRRRARTPVRRDPQRERACRADAARRRIRAPVRRGEGSKLDARAARNHRARPSSSKGADSVVAAPDGARASLQRAGLAGDRRIGRRARRNDLQPLAQGHAGLEAASAAVWMHGEAANAFGPGLIAGHSEALPKVWRALVAGWGSLDRRRSAPAHRGSRVFSSMPGAVASAKPQVDQNFPVPYGCQRQRAGRFRRATFTRMSTSARAAPPPRASARMAMSCR